MAELPDPLHKAETIIVSIVCIVSVLITGGELVYSKFTKAPLPVQIGVVIALVVLAAWLVWFKRAKND